MGCTGRESVKEKEIQKINRINDQKENNTNRNENKNKEEFGLEKERRKEEEEKRKREEEERRKEEEKRKKEEEEKRKREEEERRKKELIKTNDGFNDVYTFFQNEFKSYKHWDYIKICNQVNMYFTPYSKGYSYQYGYVHTLEDSPEVIERRQKRREEEYEKKREEEEKIRKIELEKKLEEELNSFPFIKDHMRILPETYASSHEIAIHFGHSEGPISPKDDGGYYLAYYNSKDSNLHVLEFSSQDELKNDFNTKYNAYPHDITTTSNGFV